MQRVETMNGMTDFQLRERIAQLIEWEPGNVDVCFTVGYIHHELEEMPGWPNDLPAMQKVVLEAKLKDDHFAEKYLGQLALVLSDGGDQRLYPCWKVGAY